MLLPIMLRQLTPVLLPISHIVRLAPVVDVVIVVIVVIVVVVDTIALSVVTVVTTALTVVVIVVDVDMTAVSVAAGVVTAAAIVVTDVDAEIVATAVITVAVVVVGITVEPKRMKTVLSLRPAKSLSLDVVTTTSVAAGATENLEVAAVVNGTIAGEETAVAAVAVPRQPMAVHLR